MDVDDNSSRSSYTATVFYLSLFDTTSSHFAWRDSRPREIQERRAALTDSLLFDNLLLLGGIEDPDRLFPPSTPDALGTLLDAINASQYDDMKKDCLVYYLLKWHEDGREENFRRNRLIHPQFALLADAYWHLDAGVDLERAVAILSDARLNQDYSSKIITALLESPSSASLILKYIRTAKPPLTEPDDLNAYLLALAETNFADAWKFQRTFSEHDLMRRRLLLNLLEWTVIPTSRTTALTQLLALPMSPFEENFICQFALQPPSNLPSSALAVMQNLICVRLIAAGKYADAVKMDRRLLAESPLKGHQPDRVKLMNDLHSVLSPTERALLDVELDMRSKGKPSVSTSKDDVSMPSSLEEVHVPSPHAKPKVNGIASTSGKPRPFTLDPTRTPSSSGYGLFRNSSSSAAPASPAFGAMSTIPSSGYGLFGNPSSSAVPMSTLPSSGSGLFGKSTTAISPTITAFGGSNSLNSSGRGLFGNSTSINGTPDKYSFNSLTQSILDTTRDSPAPLIPRKVNDFQSARNRPNAFYTPPVLNNNIPDKPTPTTVMETTTFATPPRSPSMDVDDASVDVDGYRNGYISPDDAMDTSIFEGRPSAPEAPPQKAPSKRTRASMRRSIPGGFVGEMDDEDENDEVAPLPVKRTTRKSRVAVAPSEVSNSDGDEEAAPKRRRSSRLSHTPSVASEAGTTPRKAPPATRAKSKKTTGTRKKRS